MKTIVITISGGIVQEIENIPEGVVVEVQDFDIDEIDPELHGVYTNKRGEEYTSETWGNLP